MKEIQLNKMIEITGGFSFSASFITAIVGGLKFLYDLGRQAGGTIRRTTSGNICNFR